jgi:hypothetical protein
VTNKSGLAGLKCIHYPRALNDIPRFAVITLVAPGERFNALAIFRDAFLISRSSFQHPKVFRASEPADRPTKRRSTSFGLQVSIRSLVRPPLRLVFKLRWNEIP